MTPRVAIVGGGPVGLYLALALLHEGIEPRVYEQRITPAHGSRSIGVHPPSIELFDEIGVAHVFLSQAVHVRRGLAFGDRGAVGHVSFDRCPPPHRFVATLEQHATEAILRDALRTRSPDALVEAHAVAHARNGEERATLTVRTPDGRVEDRAYDAVIGADGRRSTTRRALGASFDGDAYEGEYAMADAPDTTSFGDAAAVFLAADGLVESFPLPRARRRWVVRRARDHADGAAPTGAEIARLVAARCRVSIDAAQLERPSSFRAEHRLASTLASGRIALVGDAAHIVSPIGGQGMNLGWLGARSVARALGATLCAGRDPTDALARDAHHRRAQAVVATRRAEMNMWLGRPTPRPKARDAIVGTLLALPTAHLLARAFTMRALSLGV